MDYSQLPNAGRRLLRKLREPPAEPVAARWQAEIYQRMLAGSEFKQANFDAIRELSLAKLFDAYDELYFNGACRAALAGASLGFHLSKRMTRSGGQTTFRKVGLKQGRTVREYRISVSLPILWQNFHADAHRQVTVAGLACSDRLEALQRILEHELVHLIEFLLWEHSNCSAGRFQKIAAGNFRHSDHRHGLITSREVARAKYGITVGTAVMFQFEGARYRGIVNRITKRATVLVEDPRGEAYDDGKRYRKFYVPLSQLQRIAP